MDRARMQMLIAVLQKSGFKLHDRDVYISAAGGLRVTEPAADLAIAAAIASSIREAPIPHRTLLFGEIGLVGEIRAVSHPAQRLHEAQRHGFTRVIVPKSAKIHHRRTRSGAVEPKTSAGAALFRRIALVIEMVRDMIHKTDCVECQSVDDIHAVYSGTWRYASVLVASAVGQW